MNAGSELDDRLETWEQVRNELAFSGLLLGNGASRAVWEKFDYPSLFNVATDENKECRLEPQDVE